MDERIIQSLSTITEEERLLLEGQGEIGIEKERYMSHDDMVIDSRKLLEHGRLITVRPHTRFVHFPSHTHNYVEVFYMCQGKTTHIVDGNQIEVKQGDLLFMSQNATHEIMRAEKDDIGVNFIILPEFFDTAFRMMGEEASLLQNFLVGCLCGDTRYERYLHFQPAGILPIQNLVENMVWTLLNDKQQDVSLNQATMGLLLQHLSYYTDYISRPEAQSDEQRLIFQVLRYIDEHYRDGSLLELAELINYNVYSLSRLIKRNLGRNYKELLQIKRLNQAAFFLQNTKMIITDISIAVGYENTSYFHRIFKEYYGMSPKEYRG